MKDVHLYILKGNLPDSIQVYLAHLAYSEAT